MIDVGKDNMPRRKEADMSLEQRKKVSALQREAEELNKVLSEAYYEPLDEKVVAKLKEEIGRLSDEEINYLITLTSFDPAEGAELDGFREISEVSDDEFRAADESLRGKGLVHLGSPRWEVDAEKMRIVQNTNSDRRHLKPDVHYFCDNL